MFSGQRHGVTQGGADINYSGAAIVGLADVGDSIRAIKNRVFDQKKITVSRMLKAINMRVWEDLPRLSRLIS